jgi:hypothetical protein
MEKCEAVPLLSKRQIEKEMEKIRKLHECYGFALANADNENLKNKIMEIAQAHLNAKLSALTCSAGNAREARINELRKSILKLK